MSLPFRCKIEKCVFHFQLHKLLSMTTVLLLLQSIFFFWNYSFHYNVHSLSLTRLHLWNSEILDFFLWQHFRYLHFKNFIFSILIFLKIVGMYKLLTHNLSISSIVGKILFAMYFSLRWMYRFKYFFRLYNLFIKKTYSIIEKCTLWIMFLNGKLYLREIVNLCNQTL